MTRFTAMLKKEWIEAARTYRLLIMLGAFAFFGILGPLTAKFTPSLLEMMGMGEMAGVIPPPSALDSYAQLFKNATQMGMIVLLLVFGGTLSNEISRGTLSLTLSTGVSRSAILLAKYGVSLMIWTLSLALTALLTYGYTRFLFAEAAPPGLLFSLLCLWAFGALVLAVILFFSSFVPGTAGTLGMALLFFGLVLLLNLFPPFKGNTPLFLASANLSLATGELPHRSAIWPLVSTGVLTASALLSGCALFKRRQV